SVSLVLACTVGLLIAQTRTGQTANQPNAPRDATAEAQTPRQVPTTRPEQQKSDHDRMDFDSRKAMPASPVFKTQPKEGQISGFDFYRDPLNADHPFTTFEEIMQKESAGRPAVMAAQRKMLESRYDLTPRPDPQAKMSRGKPIPVGPT